MQITKNRITLSIASFLIGVVVTTLFLYQFIGSQRNQGYNEGFLNGKIDIFEFLANNVKNDVSDKKIKKTIKNYGFKYFNISVVEINGVQTVQMHGMDY